MRVFLGFRPAAAILEEIGKLQQMFVKELPFARPISLENLHITLHFLGEINHSQLESIREIGHKASQYSTLHQSIDQVIGLPTSQRARILALSANTCQPTLRTLWLDFGKLLQDRGFHLDDRQFRPHITIARMRMRAELTGLTRHAVSLQVPIQSITLFESHLNSKYAVLEEFPFLNTL